MATLNATNDLLDLKARIEKLDKEKNGAIARRDVLKHTYDQKIEELQQAGVSTENLELTLVELQQKRDELKQSVEQEVITMEAKLKELKGV
ncbi:MAG: hypothetical protein M0R17_01840 [Candidatus Omnitrophica bacterium]|jgi:cell division protein ZapA (FtsZ GTPase activity inhibitor)|nr:hypothetical protein [Candidatus Omnitrophota bacterium]